MMEVIATAVVGAVIVVAGWQIYKKLAERGYVKPPSQVFYTKKSRPRITFEPEQEQQLWEDIVKRLKK